jgi:toxin FitB
VRAVLDTSVLIGGESLPAGVESAISTVSVAELHFGLLVAPDDDTRALRSTRLGLVEARYPDPLPVDDRVAREWDGFRPQLPTEVGSRVGAMPI